jgi:protease I
MAKVCVLVASDFEDSELTVPLERLRDAGHDPELVGIERGVTLSGKNRRTTVKTEAAVTERRVSDYDALLIPGGKSPAHLRRDPRTVELVRDFGASGKPIAAVCHGPQLLIAAELVAGRTMTAWSEVQDELRAAGAEAVDREVVVDGSFVTSRKPEDLDAFCDAFLERLGAGDVAARHGEPPRPGAHRVRQAHPS